MEIDSARTGRFTRVKHVAQTGSTYHDLVSAASQDAALPLVLIADEQTDGRGRRDRKWEMPSGGGLLISFFVPWVDRTTAHLVPTCLGLAITGAAEAVGRSAWLKWPNDVVDTGDLKLGGMLSSTVVIDGAIAGVVAGLGCNVSWPTEEETSLPDATCLDRMGTSPVDRVELATELISAFDQSLALAQSHGVTAVHDLYRQRCRTIGQEVRVQRGDGVLTGRATDIDPTGALVLDVAGVQHRIDVGDVVHLRPSRSVALDE